MSDDILVRELALRGGVAPRSALPVTKRQLRHALATGVIGRERRGLYVLREPEEALLRARAVGGARSHRSAALAHGFAVATPPQLPEVVVPLGRRVPDAQRGRCVVRRRALSADEREHALTGPLTTVVACLRDLGGTEGLVVADSAVRLGAVTSEEVSGALAADRGHGVRSARELARHIDPGSESALETVLRHRALAVEGLALRTQVTITGRGWSARVDLADPDLGIVAEADSFTWHGSRAALAHDARRYDHLTGAGWHVLRFTYEAVFFEPQWVVSRLREAVALRSALRDAGLCHWRASLRHTADDPTHLGNVP